MNTHAGVGQGTPLLQHRGLTQAQGKALLTTMHGAAQALKLYPFENATVQNALGEVGRVARRIIETDGGIELRLAGDFLFLNEVRLRLELSSYGAFSMLTGLLRRHEIGGIEVEPEVGPGDWGPFLSLLLQDPPADDPFTRFVARLEATPARRITVQRQRDDEGLPEEDEEAREAAKRTYAQSVAVVREVLTDVRLARAVTGRKIKRAVQAIVDQVLSNESSILGMTALREFDEYTFTHSVNVCIFSTVIGQKLGFNRIQLYELGLGALLHDIGKMRIPPEVLNKGRNLTDDDWHVLRQHPTDGLLALFSMHGFGDVPYRSMLATYEHHMRTDLSGYPKNRRPRKPSLFSRIVAVADGFDAATSKRSYQAVPWPPDAVLREMRDNVKLGFDPLIVKAFINVTGVYPVGTLAILDTYELAVVVSRNPDPRKLHQPIVKVLADPMGLPLAKPVVADLAEEDPETGNARRSIIKTTDPEKYGIDVGEYFL